MFSNNAKALENFSSPLLKISVPWNRIILELLHHANKIVIQGLSVPVRMYFEHNISDRETGKMLSLIRFYSSLLVRKHVT